LRDAHSFDDFYRATAPRILRYAVAVTGDRHEAQDAVQEAYARAWRRWTSVSTHPAPEAWVRLTVSRLAIDRRRRLLGLWSALSRAASRESYAPPDENTVVLVAALRKLPAKQRQALALHYLCDLPVEQIATEMGAAVGTVKSWLSRGRVSLAVHLTESMTPSLEVYRA
jgi:RNA polymerase sigma-70 factor, ECF subfamily